MDLVELFDELKQYNIYLWVNSGNQLCFSFDKEKGFDYELKSQLAANKDELLETLKNNQIFSEKTARERPYLALSQKYWPRELDSIQRGMLLQSQMDVLPYTYTVPLFVRIPNADSRRMQRALRRFLGLQPIFRQSVTKGLERIILDDTVFELELKIIHERELAAHLLGLAKQVFPLSQGQFARFMLLTLADSNDAVLACIHHHMLSDAASVPHIIQHLMREYTSAEDGGGKAPPLTYFDYSAYQQQELHREGAQALRRTLVAQLNQAAPPELRQRYLSDWKNQAVSLQASLTRQESAQLIAWCGEKQLTLYPLLVTKFAHVLRLFSGQETIFPIGITLANRPETFSDAIGPFISTLPLVPDLQLTESTLRNVRSVHEAILELQQHPHLNLEQLVAEVDGGAARLADLVQVVFTFHNFVQRPLDVAGIDYCLIPYPELAEKFGISLIAKQVDGQIDFTLSYAENRYDGGYINSIFNSFMQALCGFSASSWQEPLDRADLLPPAVRELMLGEWNNTDCAFSLQDTIASLFEQQVSLTPNNLACADHYQRLSYRELNQRANQMARELWRCGVGCGSLVALCLDRGVELLVSTLAILKLGAAYIPIDSAFPDERIDYMLRDSEPAITICNQGSLERLVAPGRKLMALDCSELMQGLASNSDENLNSRVTGGDLAYVIYTSGTTGRPKGVMCEHRGVINRIKWMGKAYPLAPSDRVMQKTHYIFDVSVWELFWALFHGAGIIFAAPDGHKDTDYLIELIIHEKVSVIHFVPSMLTAFIMALQIKEFECISELKSLRYLFCSGEELKITQVRDTKKLLPHFSIYNLYGPTEASIDVLHFSCNDRAMDKVLIGKPIDNIKALVLDDKLNLLPTGVVGELHISGVGLARGYLNNAPLTKEKFIPNPYQTEQEKITGEYDRLYKTGDLVYQDENGNFVYVGRNDSQVKIRGYRIELKEIEHILEGHSGIIQAVVQIVHQSQARLIAYYVTSRELAAEDLQGYLAARLPAYMIPEVFLRLMTIPVTANGKLDFKRLPEPPPLVIEERVAPRDKLEADLHMIVASIMGIDANQLSCAANLYQLGMDSITAIQLVSRLRKSLGASISVKELFASKTVQAIYLRIVKNRDQPPTKYKAEQGLLLGEVPLLPIQSWFFSCNFAEPHYWNQVFFINVPVLDVKRLEWAIQQLLWHHDALRMSFRLTERTVLQQYLPLGTIPALLRLDLDQEAAGWQELLHTTLTTWQSGFVLESGPLYRFGYITMTGSNRAKIFCVCHHLVIDTVSWSIIIRDLQQVYQGKQLSPKGTSYRQWSNYFTEYPQYHPQEIVYWEKLLGDYVSGGYLQPQNVPLPNRLHASLPKSCTEALIKECHHAFNTQVQDLLLACADRSLSSLFRGEITHLTVEGHGREEIDPSLDIRDCVGWFTTMYPWRLSGTEDREECLVAAKEQLRAVPNHGAGFLAFRRMNVLPLPSVCFNYLGCLEQQGSQENMDWHLEMAPSENTIDPDNYLPFNLTIFSYIMDGKLHIELLSTLDTARIEELLDSFSREITQMVDFCCQRNCTTYTRSDFAAVADESDLKSLMLHGGEESGASFAMTEIQKAYLIGRSEQYEIGNVSNHIYNEFVYKELDVVRLEEAVNRLIAVCPVLRSIYDEQSMTQRFLSAAEVGRYTITLNDLRCSDENKELLRSIRERLSHKVYHVDRFPLFTFEVTRLPDHYVLHISLDLILLDVQSRLVLYGLLDKLYRGEEIDGQLTRVNFKHYQDYIVNLKDSLWYQRDRAYWQKKIGQMPLRANLPTKVASSSVSHPRFAESTIYVDAGIWQRFKQQAQRYQVSCSSVLLSLYGYLIARYSGNAEFLITLTLFNRYAVCEQVNEILGDFTSTSLLHFRDNGPELLTTIKTTHDRMWEDINHALYSGVAVQRELSKLHGLDMNIAVSPLVFTGVLGQQTNLWDSRPYLEDHEEVAQRYWCAQTSQAWIDLQAVEAGDRFMSKWLYVEQLFDEETITQFNRLYCGLITHLAEQPWEASLGYESYLSSAQIDLIIQDILEGKVVIEETLFSAFERLACLPGQRERIAVYDAQSGCSFTYWQLQRDSHLLAIELQSHQGELVAILAEKGYAQACACLAIIKSGKGYIPLHIEWPVARIREVLEQAGVNEVLISAAQYGRAEMCELTKSDCQLQVIEELLQQPESHEVAVLPSVSAGDIAYIIFTSGSTGKPKGVTISHQGAVNTLQAVNSRLNLGPQDVLFALSDLSFDLSVYDLFGALSVGAKIVFPAQNMVKDPDSWLPLLTQHNVTVWNSVPQFTSLLADAAANWKSKLPPLRAFLMSGDWIPLNLPQKLRLQWPLAEQISLGGATEGSIWSIWYTIDHLEPHWHAIPYGTAMPNQTIYVLDKRLLPCPVGVTGEIYIGGIGVACNYFGNPELTAESFIPHTQWGRMYRTGDLGRWNNGGYIEFLGRDDFQVKLRGHRVELGEVEGRLLQIQGIRQVLAVIRKEPTTCLVAYYVSDCPLDEMRLRDILRQYLPEYMVPDYFIALSKLPLTGNGKLDRKALRCLVPSVLAGIKNYVRHVMTVRENFVVYGQRS